MYVELVFYEVHVRAYEYVNRPCKASLSSLSIGATPWGTGGRGGFLPRCMVCRRGLAMRILSVCLSVFLSNA